MEEDSYKGFWKGLGLISFFSFSVAFSFIFYKPPKSENIEYMLNQVAIKADINKDGVISKSEWVEVYKRIGVDFDESNPRKLSISELEKYLRIPE